LTLSPAFNATRPLASIFWLPDRAGKIRFEMTYPEVSLMHRCAGAGSPADLGLRYACIEVRASSFKKIPAAYPRKTADEPSQRIRGSMENTVAVSAGVFGRRVAFTDEMVRHFLKPTIRD
jgi:hypothetical protein